MPHHLTQALDPSGFRNRALLAQLYGNTLKQGIRPFVKLICEHELECTTLRGTDLKHVLHDAYMMFICMHSEIVSGLIDGDLTQKFAVAGSEVQKTLDMLYRRAEQTNHPGIYMNAITDDRGRSPKVRHLQAALNDFHIYCFGAHARAERLAGEMDSLMGAGTDLEKRVPGSRKYLCSATDTGSKLPIASRLQSAGTFHKYFSNALSAVDHDDHEEPFHDVLVEFGFSSVLMDRLAQHQAHESSNHLMGLFHACLKRRYQDRYRLKQYVIHLCAAQRHASLAEIIITRMGQGYVTSGTGFSHYPAGRSVPLGRRSVQQWAEYFAWIVEHTPMEEHHERDVALSKEKAAEGSSSEQEEIVGAHSTSNGSEQQASTPISLVLRDVMEISRNLLSS